MNATTTKLDQVRALLAAGNTRKALAIASKWARLGMDAATIKRGHAAASNPALYAQMKLDPVALEAAGVKALQWHVATAEQKQDFS